MQGWSALQCSSPHPKGEFSSVAHCLSTPCSNEQGAGSGLLSHPQGGLSHTYTFRASSTVWSRRGVGPLSQVLQLVMGRNSSPAPMTSGPAFLPATGSVCVCVYACMCVSPVHDTIEQIRGCARSPVLTFSGWFAGTPSIASAPLCLCHQGELYCAAQVKSRARFPGCCSWW